MRSAFSQPHQLIDDVHFDELAGPWKDGRDGLDWVAYYCAVLRKVRRAAHMYENLLGVRHAVVALPLGSTIHVRVWKSNDWRLAGTRTEPPSLILIKNDRFGERYDEEYFRRLDLPIKGYREISAIYRSQRNLIGLDENVDFDNVVFLVTDLRTKSGDRLRTR